MKNRFPALDFLRVCAIAGVILYHLHDRLAQVASPAILKIAAFGSSGVDLFFVLSGFLIGRIILSEIHKTGQFRIGSFWYRRWMRTLPAYYAVLLAIILSDAVIRPEHPWTFLPSYFVFLQNYMWQDMLMRFSWSWSLCVEEWFYLLLPLFVVALLYYRKSPVAVLRLIAISAWIVSVLCRYRIYLMHQETGLADSASYHLEVYFPTHMRLDGLAAGLLICTLPKPKTSVWTISLFFAALIGLAIFVFSDHGRILDYEKFALFSVLFGSMVYCSLTENVVTKTHIPFNRFFADLSYSLYLVHPIFSKIVYKYFPTTNFWLTLPMYLGLTLAASLILRYCVELPFLWLRDKSPTGPAKKSIVLTPAPEVSHTP